MKTKKVVGMPERVRCILDADDFENRVKALREEAATAGDLEMVATCDRALGDSYADQVEAASALADAEAQS